MSERNTVTPAQARAAIAEHGGVRAAGRALGVDHGFLCRLAKRKDGPSAPVKPKAGGTAGREPYVDEAAAKPASGPAVGGFVLTAVTRFADKRPAASMRSKLYSLPKGRAFPIAALAKEWRFSAETIRRHAKDEECFAYIDTTGHDDWVECVMHPETAAARLQKQGEEE